MASTIKYEIRRSSRARSVRITILGRDEVIVTAPARVSAELIERFVRSKSDWIESKLARLRLLPDHMFLQSSKKDYEQFKKAAHVIAEQRLAHFNASYGFDFKKISIRNQKTRWGSCSKTGTVCFNYKIALLPPHLADYIIVHELCHIGEMNHSKKFWALVARTIPDYRSLRAELNGRRLKA